MTPDELLERFRGSPALHVHQVDLAADAALIVSLGAETYRSASFLDDRALVPGTSGFWIPLPELAAAASALGCARPLHFIWHTGHVGSTLVNRLLDEVPGVLSLREPQPLRTLADASDALGTAHSLMGEEQHRRLAGALTSAWSRGYDETRCVVVKGASAAARVAQLASRQAPAARSIYLNVRREPYLATALARSGPPVDLRSYGPERVRRLQSSLSVPAQPLWSMSVGELAAMSWLTETLTQRDVTRALGERVLSLDFDAVLADVGGSMRRVLEHFALSPDDAYSARVESSPVLGRYSKGPDTPYSPAIRRQALDRSRERHGDEIRKGLLWLERLARSEASVAEALQE